MPSVLSSSGIIINRKEGMLPCIHSSKHSNVSVGGTQSRGGGGGGGM